MITTKYALFVLDSEMSNDFFKHYRTEVSLMELEIKVDNTSCRPYYQLFRWYKVGKRKVKEELYASSRLEKIIEAVNDFLKKDQRDTSFF